MKNLFELPSAQITLLGIEELPGSKPVASKSYGANAENTAELTRQIVDWRAMGLVVDTTFSYASPAQLVNKKDRSKRPVFDFRCLIAQTVEQKYPLPNIEDHLESLSSAKLFTILDLVSGKFVGN